MTSRRNTDQTDRANARLRVSRREHCRIMRENAQIQRQMPPLPHVAVERVNVPREIHLLNEASQPLVETPHPGLTGPICRSGIVRNQVNSKWPIGHQMWYKCQFQVLDYQGNPLLGVSTNERSRNRDYLRAHLLAKRTHVLSETRLQTHGERFTDDTSGFALNQMSNGQVVWPPAFGLNRFNCGNCRYNCARTLSEALMEIADERDMGRGVRAKVKLDCGPRGIMRGKEASDFLRYQQRNANQLAAEGRTRVFYWGSGQGSEALAFDGQYEVDQLARNERPDHLAPFINHCDEGNEDHNVQAIHIRMTLPPGGRPYPHSPSACLVYITIREVQKGEFLHAAYESNARGVSTAEDRRDRGGMGYVNRR